MRGFLIAASNMFSYIMQIWFQLAVWRTVEGPKFHAGFTAAAVTGALMIVLTITLRFLQKRDERKRAKEAEGAQDIETPAPGRLSVEVATNLAEAPRTVIAGSQGRSYLDSV